MTSLALNNWALVFTGIYIIFLISAQKQRGSSNEYPKSMFWVEIWNISEFLSENFQFLVVKFSIHLNRHIFVMVNESSGQTDRRPRSACTFVQCDHSKTHFLLNDNGARTPTHTLSSHQHNSMPDPLGQKQMWCCMTVAPWVGIKQTGLKSIQYFKSRMR